MQHRFLITGIAILAVFCLGLVGFFVVSEGKPDGLETVMEEQGIEEPPPIWTAPLDYGSDYLSALVMGIVGAGLVLTVTFAYLKAAKKRQQGTK
jgi:hypothetical protein